MASKITQPDSDLTKRDFRALILILFKLQKTRLDIHETLVEHFPDVAPSLRTVERWYSEFKYGEFTFDDAPRTGRPNISNIDENVQLV